MVFVLCVQTAASELVSRLVLLDVTVLLTHSAAQVVSYVQLELSSTLTLSTSLSDFTPSYKL